MRQRLPLQACSVCLSVVVGLAAPRGRGKIVTTPLGGITEVTAVGLQESAGRRHGGEFWREASSLGRGLEPVWLLSPEWGLHVVATVLKGKIIF